MSSRDDEMVVQEYFSYLGGNIQKTVRKMSLLQPEEEPKEEAAPAKPVVGIIYPPPEVRNIVDKTASFVAR